MWTAHLLQLCARLLLLGIECDHLRAVPEVKLAQLLRGGEVWVRGEVGRELGRPRA